MPREKPATRTDEWTTPPEIVDIVLAQFGRIDLDPCSHPESAASKVAAQRFDIRAGQDGLALDWPLGARVYVNPPYKRGQVKRFAAKCAAHARAGGEVLMLVNAGVGGLYWRDEIWPHIAAACFLCPRVRFAKNGGGEYTENLADSVVCYFGSNPDAFTAAWRARGTVVRVVAVQGSTGDEGQLQAADAVQVAPRELAARMVADLLVRTRVTSGEGAARIDAAHKAAEAVRREHGALTPAYHTAQLQAAQAVQDAISEHREAARIEAAAHAFLAALEPPQPVRAPMSWTESEARRKAARNAAKVTRAERLAQARDAQEAAQAVTEPDVMEAAA